MSKTYVFADIESHNSGRQYGMPKEEFFRLGQYAINDGPVLLTTDYDEFMGVLDSADYVVFHNGISFDLPVLYGVDSLRPLEMAIERKVIDTFVLASLVNPAPYHYVNKDGRDVYDGAKPERAKKWLSLDEQAHQLGVEGKLGNLQELAKKYNPPKTAVRDLDYGLIPLDDPDFLAYARQDVIALRDVYYRLIDMLQRQKYSGEYVWREMLVWSINAQITRNGVLVNTAEAQARVDELAADRDRIMEWLVREFDMPEITPKSKQPWKSNAGKGAIIKAFESFGIVPEGNKTWERTASGAPSFSGDTMKAISEGTEAAELGEALAALQGQRSLAQLALESTYEDGRIHPEIACLQRSGRTSVQRPGLTVWTARGPGAVEKRYFIADPGHVMVEMDYSACFNPNSKVLTDNLEWVTVGDLTPGDSVIGFDESLDYHSCKMRTAQVTHVSKVRLPSVKLTLSNGDTLITSANHLHPVKYGKSKRKWQEASEITPGAAMVKWASSPWEEFDDFDSGWISGMYDGEGWVSSVGRSSVIGVAQTPGAVWDRLVEWHRANGFESATDYKSNGVNVLRVGKIRKKVELLGRLRPTRLLPKHRKVWEGKSPFNASTEMPTVVSVEDVGVLELVSVGTSTGTLVVDGYLTHNCDARVVAAVSGDGAFAERFAPGADAHEITGRIFFGEKYDEDPKYYRNKTKPGTHGMSYRIGAKKLAATLDVTVQEAMDFLDQYRAAYPWVSRWQDQVTREGDKGRVTNWWGRKMVVDPDRSFNQSSALIGQSSTREILFDGLIAIVLDRIEVIRWLRMTVHDACVWSIPETEKEWAVPYILDKMTQVFDPGTLVSQPVEFPMSVGPLDAKNWWEAGH